MPFLQSSGPISINDIKNMFGGPASPALSNYYRGGTYVQALKQFPVREPTSGEYYNQQSFYWFIDYGSYYTIRWNGVTVKTGQGTITSTTAGGYTFFRGTTIRSSYNDGYGTNYYYGVYRTYSTTISINTSVPFSGTISLQQFYGAEKP